MYKRQGKNIIKPYIEGEKKIVKKKFDKIKETIIFRDKKDEVSERILQEITKDIECAGIKVNKIIYQNTNLDYKIINTTIDDIIAVSYTHLDVYKRQGHRRFI